jgi:ribonuclease HIII
MPPRTSFTQPLTEPQQAALEALLRAGNYRLFDAPYARIAAQGADCNIVLYTSGKCVVQGRGAEAWITFTLEPQILKAVRLGYEAALDPALAAAHMGVDESGKGDFFGPMIIAAAYVDPSIYPKFRDLGVRDSKTITSDRKAEEMAGQIVDILGPRFAVVPIGPRAYNRLYASMRNVNRILAWGHARAIENLLEKVPGCPRAVSDQFGPVRQIQTALMQKGRRIELVQMPRAESDPAVAAASVIARAAFLRALRELGLRHGIPLPKGASDLVQDAARRLVEAKGAAILAETAKCHFRTTDVVLGRLGLDRAAIGPEGRAVSKPGSFRRGSRAGTGKEQA